MAQLLRESASVQISANSEDAYSTIGMKIQRRKISWAVNDLIESRLTFLLYFLGVIRTHFRSFGYQIDAKVSYFALFGRAVPRFPVALLIIPLFNIIASVSRTDDTNFWDILLLFI